MDTPAFENDEKILNRDLIDSGMKFESLSQNQSQNRSSKSPLSKGNTSPKHYSSQLSYQRASQISPTLEIESNIILKQDPFKIYQDTYEQKYFPKPKDLHFNENTIDSQNQSKKKASFQDPLKQIVSLKSRIKEEQFLIELENAVHKELMNIISKKDKSLTSLKSQKLDSNTCYEIEEQTQIYLDKAEFYVKEMKKLEQIARNHFN